MSRHTGSDHPPGGQPPRGGDTPGGDHTVITQEEARALIAAGSVRVLDVRNPDEWAGLGTIPGAVLATSNAHLGTTWPNRPTGRRSGLMDLSR